MPDNSPISLKPNPVWRGYRGGRALREFRGRNGTPDDHFPEDWLASSVLARNGEKSQGAREGISLIEFEGREMEFPALRECAPGFFPSVLSAANEASLGVLIKLLDAADRLHFQAHPNDEFVRTRLGGEQGKTECWYILSTRGEAFVQLGFQRPPERGAFQEMIETQDVSAMLSCFDPIAVSPGDCFVVPAGVPHAIGAGIFMLELQQPSDWVVRCEFSASGHTMPENARFMGLSLEECMDVFDFSAHATNEFKQYPTLLRQASGFTEESIIDPAYAPYFRLRRLRGTTPADFGVCEPNLFIATCGSGLLKLGTSASRIEQGSTFLLPAHTASAQWYPDPGPWEFLLAQSPLQPTPSHS